MGGKRIAMKKSSMIPVVIGVTALVVGAATMGTLFAIRKPPASASPTDQEKAVRVEALKVVPRDVPVTITGYGEVSVLKTVSVAPEVSGKVVEIHPNLIVGGIIPQGEALFVIDPDPYRAQVDDAAATVDQLTGTIARLKEEWTNERLRIDSMDRARDLAKGQYERLKQLLTEDVGTQTDVDSAEQTYVIARDQADQLSHELDLFPIRIDEAQATLKSAQARLELARLSLEKTRLTAPFNARVKWRAVEKDQFANAGEDLVKLADDSVLEIPVPLDSRDARRWLRFNEERVADGTAWFTRLGPVECAVHWTEETNGHAWKGTLDRVESFDESSRTLTVVVRVLGYDAIDGDSDVLPLVEGMFCRVEIPGRVMKDVFAIPQSAVSFENTVFMAVENRLKTVPIEVARLQGPYAYVSGGLSPGDLIISTRLVNPLDHTLLDVTVVNEEAP